MEYSTTDSPLKAANHINIMSIDPDKELFDSTAPPPSAAPPTPDIEDDKEARERQIEGGAAGGGTLHLSVSDQCGYPICCMSITLCSLKDKPNTVHLSSLNR